MTLVVVWTWFVSIFVSEIMNSLGSHLRPRDVWGGLKQTQQSSASAGRGNSQVGERFTWKFLKSNATSRVSSDQVLQFNRLQLSLMSLYSAWEAPGRYMICCWSTWEEVESRLLDWTINRLQQKPSPTSDADHHHYYHHHHQQHHHSYHHPSPTWDADQCDHCLCRFNDVAVGWNLASDPDVGRPFCACQPVIEGIWARVKKVGLNMILYFAGSRMKDTRKIQAGLGANCKGAWV